jgi:hypothetical protein
LRNFNSADRVFKAPSYVYAIVQHSSHAGLPDGIKIPIWEYFGGTLNIKYWHIYDYLVFLRPFG